MNAHGLIAPRPSDIPVRGASILPTFGPASGEPLTMSSLEIAELTGKRHDNVLSDIRKMLEELGKTPPEFSGHVPDSYGRPRFVFNLPKRETMILVSGYSITLRARIVDRWQELEAQLAQPPAPQFAIPQTLPEALRLAAEQAERAIAAEEKLAIAAPKAQALDELADAEGTYTLTEAAKNFRIPPRKEFVAVLLEWGVLYQRGKSSPILPTERFLQAGYFVVKANRFGRSLTQQTRVTAKGMAWLATKLHRFEREGAF